MALILEKSVSNRRIYHTVRFLRRWMVTIWSVILLTIPGIGNAIWLLIFTAFLWDFFITPKSSDLRDHPFENEIEKPIMIWAPKSKSLFWQRMLLIMMYSICVGISGLAAYSLISIELARFLLAGVTLTLLAYISFFTASRWDGVIQKSKRVNARISQLQLTWFNPIGMMIALILGRAVVFTVMHLQGPIDAANEMLYLSLIDFFLLVLVGLTSAWLPTNHFLIKSRFEK